METNETSTAGGIRSGALERGGGPVDSTPGLPQMIDARDRDKGRCLHEDDASHRELSHLSVTSSTAKLSHTASGSSRPCTNLSTERDCPHSTSGTKKSATCLLREESCFRMVELADALAVVDREVHSAVQIQLRNQRLSRVSQMKTVGQDGDSSQATQPYGSPLEQARLLGAEVSSLRQDGTKGEGEKSRSTPCRSVDFVLSEDRLIETIAPPFIGRRVGAPEGVIAPFALPPFRASVVDGYALHIPSGGWREVQELYRVTYLREQVKLEAGHTGDDRVALEITGEVRAGAHLTSGTVQPFRGHPHILAEMRGTGPDRGARCCLSKQTNKCFRRFPETRDAALPAALQCVYVTTGSPVPEWCNAVIPVESCEVDIDECLCWPDNEVIAEISGMGENIREVGSDAPAKSPLMQQGQLVGPAEEGVLASVGLEKLDVFRRLNVHTLALGDELRSQVGAHTSESGNYRSDALQNECGRRRRHMVDPFPALDNNGNDGDLPMMTQESICSTHEKQTADCAKRAAVYDSNTPMLKALLSQHCPSTHLGHQHVLPDDVDKVQRLLLGLALKEQATPVGLAGETQTRSRPLRASERGRQDECVDVLVSTGGVSMGGSDCMKLALLQLQRNSFEQRQCGKTSAGDKERLTLRGQQNRPEDGKQRCHAAADSGGRTNTTKSNEDTLQGRDRDTAGKSATTSPTNTVPLVTESWSYTVETEIKFGRLNVKPGKPTMFAVLRVFRRNAANTATMESDDGQRQQPVERGESHDWTVTRHAEIENGIVSKSALKPPMKDTLARDVSRGEVLSTTLTSYEEQQPLSSSGKTPDRQPARSPVRVLLVFALPGNPCSAWVLFHLLVAPALNLYSSFSPSSSLSAHALAQTVACLDEPVVADPIRPEYHRALVYVEHSKDKSGFRDYEDKPSAQKAQSSVRGGTAFDPGPFLLHAFPTGRQASSRLLSCCASANGLVVVAPKQISRRSGIAAGESVRILLCGTPFPVRPDPLIRLLRLQNTLTAFREARCRCAGEKESPKESSTPKSGQWQTGSTSDPIVHTEEPGDAAPPCKLSSTRSLVDAAESTVSHFSRERAVGEPVRLGIIVVSDRCFRGEMQDACAGTLLKVLRSSSAVTALLQLSSPGAPSVSLVRGNISAWRVPDGDFPDGERTWSGVKEQRERLRIVPDVIESIQDAIFGMLCACADDPNPRMHIGTDGGIPRRSLIFVCGGTGLSVRDVTPQALLPLFTIRCNGLEHLLLEHSLRCTPLASLGRPCAGVIECPASRQVGEGKGNSCSVNGDMCQPATENDGCTQADVVTSSQPQKCSRRSALSAADASQGFEGIMTDECRRPDALQNMTNTKGKETCHEVCLCRKGELVCRAAVGSASAPPESGTASARSRVDAATRNISRWPSGCGARCLVVAFPGSPQAVRELAEALLPVLPHALEQFSK